MHMRAIIGAKLLASTLAQPAAKPFEIYDTRLPGFTLRVQPSGVRSFYARIGRNRRIALGKVGDLLPDEARERCSKMLGNVAHGRHPLSGLCGPEGPTLEHAGASNRTANSGFVSGCGTDAHLAGC
jgi:hypothetical protein